MTSFKCPQCNLTNFSSDEVCKRCGKPLAIAPEPVVNDTFTDKATSKKTFVEHPVSTPIENVVTKVQGYFLIGLLIGGLLLLSWSMFRPAARYEYKVVSFLAESNERTGTNAMKYASIQVDQVQLNAMGAEGWDLVNSFLEMETAYPNFGSSEYVTGLQPNVRPQQAVFVFKRQIR